MPTRRAFTVGSILIVASVQVSALSADDRAETRWEVVRVGNSAIAVPKNWRNVPSPQPRVVLIRSGDGIDVPATDETGSPLQIGMTVEKYPGTKESLDQGARGLVEAAKNNPQLELVGKEVIEDLKLADGVEAKLLITEFIKGGDRHSLQMKLLAKDADSNGWVISGFIVGGKESKLPASNSDLAQWLRAHLASFCLDANKLDEAKLKTAYEKRDQ